MLLLKENRSSFCSLLVPWRKMELICHRQNQLNSVGLGRRCHIWTFLGNVSIAPVALSGYPCSTMELFVELIFVVNPTSYEGIWGRPEIFLCNQSLDRSESWLAIVLELGDLKILLHDVRSTSYLWGKMVGNSLASRPYKMNAFGI